MAGRIWPTNARRVGLDRARAVSVFPQTGRFPDRLSARGSFWARIARCAFVNGCSQGGVRVALEAGCVYSAGASATPHGFTVQTGIEEYEREVGGSKRAKRRVRGHQTLD